MLKRWQKQLFYNLAGPVMRINGWAYRRFRSPTSGLVKVHLGPGQSNYLDGWINVDANKFTGRCDVWADLRNPLPFRDNTVDVFYSHHVIEHLPDIWLHFREMFRCLKPNGVFRVGGPHGDWAARKLVEGDSAWFWDFPDNRKSAGGRFENFIFCRQEHLTYLTRSFLEEVAAAAGFTDLIERKPVTDTGLPQFIDAQVFSKEFESTPDAPHTLLIEGRKPA